MIFLIKYKIVGNKTVILSIAAPSDGYYVYFSCDFPSSYKHKPTTSQHCSIQQLINMINNSKNSYITPSQTKLVDIIKYINRYMYSKGSEPILCIHKVDKKTRRVFFIPSSQIVMNTDDKKIELMSTKKITETLKNTLEIKPPLKNCSQTHSSGNDSHITSSKNNPTQCMTKPRNHTLRSSKTKSNTKKDTTNLKIIPNSTVTMLVILFIRNHPKKQKSQTINLEQKTPINQEINYTFSTIYPNDDRKYNVLMIHFPTQEKVLYKTISVRALIERLESTNIIFKAKFSSSDIFDNKYCKLVNFLYASEICDNNIKFSRVLDPTFSSHLTNMNCNCFNAALDNELKSLHCTFNAFLTAIINKNMIIRSIPFFHKASRQSKVQSPYNKLPNPAQHLQIFSQATNNNKSTPETRLIEYK